MSEERRRSLLTQDDLASIQKAFAEERQSFFELIGYDVSTPESRSEIRKDHDFIRWCRIHKNKLIASAVVGAGLTVGGSAGGKDLILTLIGGG